MTRKYKKPHETTPLDAFEQSLNARRSQKETLELLNDRDREVTYAPDGLIERLLKGLKE